MELQFGDIILFKHNDFIAKMIEKITKSPYSHASICLDKWHMAEALSDGIDITHLRDLPTGYDIYRYNLNDEQKQKMQDFIYQKIACPYNYEELFACLLEKELNFKIPINKSKLICSQFVFNIFNFAGINLLPDFIGNIVTPADLSTSCILQKVGV